MAALAEQVPVPMAVAAEPKKPGAAEAGAEAVRMGGWEEELPY